MTTKAKKQTKATSRKKKLTLNKETVKDLSVSDGDIKKIVGGGVQSIGNHNC